MKIRTKPRALLPSQLNPGDTVAVTQGTEAVQTAADLVAHELTDSTAIRWLPVSYAVRRPDGWDVVVLDEDRDPVELKMENGSMIMWRDAVDIDPWSYVRSA